VTFSRLCFRSVALPRRARLTGPVFRVAVVVFALVGVASTHAHPEIEEALARIDDAIKAEPKNAALFLQRGELNAGHNDLIAADRDFRQAALFSPTLPRLDSARGSLALTKGQLPEARAFLDRAVQANPADAEALVIRAKVLAELGDHPAALADL